MRFFLCTLAAALLCIHSLVAQVPYTANQHVRPYTAGFHTGVNNGYFPDWTNEEMGALSAKVGGRSMRVGMTEEIAELFGYNILLPLFQWYERQGMKEHTVILSGPIDWHRDEVWHCPQARAALFKNLYLPVWDGGANGTPYNDDNYLAAYTYQMATTYKGYVRFWEVWNEPGLDPTGAAGWLPPGFPRNWWENDPAPCDYILHAPIQHYIRTLRIVWEVVKNVDPDAYVTCSGLGYPAFLDALLRQTDNPQGGAVTPDFPLKGGAYFDAVGFHSYPHFDGSVRYWDNGCQCMINTRHSDGAAEGIIRTWNIYKEVLKKYGYDDSTYPEKIWNITEGNIPGKIFVWGNEYLVGGPEVQRNFIIKAMVYMIQNGIVQYDLFTIFNSGNPAEAGGPFEVMGLYEYPVVPGTGAVPTMEGVACRTASLHLYGTVYDPQRTTAMQLPANTGGGAFRTPDGTYVYVLWAKTLTDQQETAALLYEVPAVLQPNALRTRFWDFSKTFVQQVSSTTTLSLTETPLFLVENPAWGLPKTDTWPQTDLELHLSATPARPSAGEEATFSLTISNTGGVGVTGVDVVDFLAFAKPFLTDRLRYISHQAPAGTVYTAQAGRWEIPVIEAGQSLTLQVRAKALHEGAVRIYAQIGKADLPDPDSEPLNGQSHKRVYEDDETSFILNNNGWVDVKADLVAETMRFPEKVPAGTQLPLTHMVRNNGRAGANASVGRYFLSTDSLWSPDDVSLGDYAVGVLLPYAYETRQAILSLPPGLSDGRYYLLFLCDATGTTDEFDENNVFARPLHIANPIPLLADLAPALLHAPDSMQVGQSVSLSVCVQNKGNAVSTFYELSVALSTDTIADAQDLPLTSGLMIPLPPGTGDTIGLSVVVPLDYTWSGRHWWLIKVRVLQPGQESDTTNNQLSRSFALHLYMPAATCRTELGIGNLLCVQNGPQGSVEVYRDTGREWFKTTLDAKGSLQKTEGPFPLVYDSVLIRHQTLIVKKADGSPVWQYPLPAALLRQLPHPAQAIPWKGGQWLIGGFRKHFDPQGIQPFHADTLVLLRADASLQVVEEMHLAYNRALISGDSLYALIPGIGDQVTVVFATIAENLIATPRLTFLLYDVGLQKSVSEEVKSGFYLKSYTQTPCGNWRFKTEYLQASIKSNWQGTSVFYLNPINAVLHHTWSVGTGSLDYFGSFRTYNFASGLTDSLTTGFSIWRSTEPLPDLVLRHRPNDTTVFLDTIPFVQFQYAQATLHGVLLLGTENGGIWAATHDCNRPSVSTNPDPSPVALRLFPNPSDGQLIVEHPDAIGAMLTLWHISGTCVHQQLLGAIRSDLDLRHLPAGSYIVMIQNGRSRITSKIILGH
jgi:hypothetical protein